MTLNKLASEIAKREGKRSQSRIGDIREILAILSDMILEGDPLDHPEWDALLASGRSRAKRRKK